MLSRGAIHAGGPYRCPNTVIRARAVATNTPPNGAFRGFGAPQTEFAAECHMDRIAAQLGMDPLEVRRANAYRVGDVTPTGQTLRESVGAHDSLERCVKRSRYLAKRPDAGIIASNHLLTGNHLKHGGNRVRHAGRQRRHFGLDQP